MRATLLLAAVLVGCGEPGAPAAASPAPGPVAPDDGDPLLARARASIRGGEIDPAVRAEILASTDPAHARARRILAAMDATDAPPTPEPLAPPPATVAPPPAAPAPAPSRPPTAALGVVTRLELSRRGDRATLELRAGSPLLVGIAAQESGIVRLLVESAGALPAALTARPEVEGLRVVDVRRMDRTIQIALELDEGWTAVRPVRTGHGARIEFRRG